MQGSDVLHCDNGNGRALCDARPLDTSKNQDSPGCEWMQLCGTCFLLSEHLGRESRRARR